MRKNEHPRCGCPACVRGAASKHGQFVHRQVNRKIRRKSKEGLRKDPDNFDPVVVSTTYTD